MIFATNWSLWSGTLERTTLMARYCPCIFFYFSTAGIRWKITLRGDLPLALSQQIT